LSVKGVDVEDSVRTSAGRFDQARVRAIGYSNRFILLKREARLWAYIGPRSDYLLVEDLYCSCGSFTRSLARQPTCIHLVALREAINAKRYRTLEVGEDVISIIAWEILATGFSRRLREAVYKKWDPEEAEGSPKGTS
jgi:predicted nucleic acid-binding Zn finger protein